jgi:recombination associated protein RdgC
MQFKNAMIYRLAPHAQISVEALETQLENLAFFPCGSQDMTRSGWFSPMGDYGVALTHAAGNQILICLKREEKILPSSVIKKELQTKLAKLEGEQHQQAEKVRKRFTERRNHSQSIASRFQPGIPDLPLD